jgi:PAS domain S-box-containing protein
LTHSGSWVTNFATGVNYHVSDEVLRIHGYDPAQGRVPLERFYETIHPEDVALVTTTIQQAIEKRTSFEIHEYRIVRPDGETRYLRALGRCTTVDTGEYIGTTIDITDRKHAADERERLRQLEAELAHINRVNMMGELAAALAHEIKQPIAASITSANALLRWLAHDPPDLDRARATATRIAEDGRRAAEIINSLRSFYKSGSASERKPININEVIDEMTVLLGTEATRHSVTITTDLQFLSNSILADRVQMQQVLMNLMLNAIEAMQGAGGELRIRSALNSEGNLIISISDTGVGLPTEGADLIFDPFHTTKPQGTGMGLTITRSIVEAYGGKVWATNNQERGASFHVALPYEDETLQ